jgi:hypothetical protein
MAAGAAILSTAAAIVIMVLAIDHRVVPERPPVVVVPEDNDAESVYRVASADDVVIISMPESAGSMLVVGEHPLRGVELKPANFDDVDLRQIGPDARGEFPELHMTPNGVSAPMVWGLPSQ